MLARVGEGVSERGVGEREQRGFQERGVESREETGGSRGWARLGWERLEWGSGSLERRLVAGKVSLGRQMELVGRSLERLSSR